MSESNTASHQVLISGRPKTYFPKIALASDPSKVGACLLYTLTLAVGLVGVVAAVVGAIADPRWVDTQRGGVAAEEIFLFDAQHEKVGAVAVVWERKGNDMQNVGVQEFIFSSIYFYFEVTWMQTCHQG